MQRRAHGIMETAFTFFSGASELVDKEISKLIFLDAVKEEINVVMILVKLLMYLYIFITRAVWG